MKHMPARRLAALAISCFALLGVAHADDPLPARTRIVAAANAGTPTVLLFNIATSEDLVVTLTDIQVPAALVSAGVVVTQGDAIAGSAKLAPLPVPDHYMQMPAATPVGPPRNVGHLYLRMARAIRDHTPVEPDFDLAVKRHRLIDAIQRASDEGRTQRLP